ncbi:linear amide C-N hydrolase [Herbiconiux daphne]|uniref:Linear amide C-N hydrolase n=1 Tax=Herbiconiux daphne TaxID=2970914 RepID=A0ABT2GXH6_9MICO|nr:linear amide C-N hydrolase [Herbiconiux daphne]MCS5732668.1 linear amide C-N hydrolase [Herbiconiux daphne]
MCTRIFWNDNAVAKTVSRCMDWAVSDEPELWFVPRGTDRTGNAGERSLAWTSRYSSVSVSMWGIGTVDGLNEKGLAAHGLYLDLDEVEYPAPDERPVISNAIWVQYLLDNFATVAEAVAAIDTVRIHSQQLRDQEMGVHIALEDASGDSAIIEPIGGRLVVHHGPEYTVMANSPSLDKQLANLAEYRPFGGELPPPGDISSLDRFVRASYFLHYLPEPENEVEAVAGVFQLIANVSPYGAPYSDGGVYPTWWQSGADLTNGVYYFGSTRSPSIFWVPLAEIADGTEVLRLDPRDVSLVGDSSSMLQPATLPY